MNMGLEHVLEISAHIQHAEDLIIVELTDWVPRLLTYACTLDP